VTYPGAGPSICDKIFRVTPGVGAGWLPSADASVAINSVIPQIAHAAKLEKPRLVSMTTTSQSLSPPSTNRAITQQDASKVCLTASVHDVTSIDARTSRIEKYTQQYWGSKASVPFLGDHRIVDSRALWHAEFSAQDIADAGRIRARTNRPAPFQRAMKPTLLAAPSPPSD